MKKLFSIVTTVAMLATLVNTSAFAAATYSTDLELAYDYAYGKGITTQSSIDNANMYGQVLRSHMAKMMVNYAKAMGKTADATAACSFTDIGNESAELKGYMVDACQMGIMGVGVSAFRPNDTVTRAEFGTVLSRVLWGDKNNGGEPYYVNHLKALNTTMVVVDGKETPIMSKIDNPTMKEIRGYVMLMMMRADSAADQKPATCSTPENVLACSLGLDSCPAECKDTAKEDDTTEVKAGSVKVRLASDATTTVSVPKVGIVVAGTLDITAGGDDVKVNSFDVTRSGLGNRSDVNRVYFEKNGVRISGRAGLTTDGKATVSFSPALVVKKGATESIDFVVDFSGSVGSEHAFKFNSMNSSAKDTDMGSITTNTLRTTDYTVGSVVFDSLGLDTTHKVGDKSLELGRFKLTNTSLDDKEVKVKSITVRNDGNGDVEKSLENIALYRDSEKVSTDAIINGKDITFVVNTKLTANQNATFYIRGDVTGVENAAGDSYKFVLRNDQDFTAVEVNTSFRTSIVRNGKSTIAGIDGDLFTYTVEGGDISFTKDSSISSTMTAAPAATDVVILKGKITTKEAITLEDATLNLQITGAAAQFVNKVTLKIGTSSSTWTPTVLGDNLTATFDGAWTITKDATVTVMVDVKSTATAGTVKILSDLNLSRFATKEYVSTQNTISSTASVGSIAGATLTVKAAKLNLSRNDGLSDRAIVKGSKAVTLMGAKFSTTESSEITVNNFDLTGTVAATGFNDNITATLYVNGVATKTATYRSGKLTFSSLNIKVKNGQDATVTVKGDFTQTVNGTIGFTLANVDATDSNSQTVTVAPIASANITMAGAGSIEITRNSSAVSSSLILTNSTDVELAKLNLVARDDMLKLTDLYFANAGTLDLNNRINTPVLYSVSGTQLVKIANGNIINGYVVFENMESNDYVVNPDANRTLVVKANINDALYTGDLTNNTLQLTLTDGYADQEAGTLSGSRFVSESNGETVTSNRSTSMLVSNLHTVVKGMPVVALQTTASSQTRLMNFSVTANGNRINLSGLTTTLANNGSATAVISIYKDSVTSANLLGSFTGANGGAISFTNAQEITAGSTLNLIAEISGYTPTGNAGGNFAREFKVTDLAFEQIFNNGNIAVGSVSSFVNVGSLPLTITYQP